MVRRSSTIFYPTLDTKTVLSLHGRTKVLQLVELGLAVYCVHNLEMQGEMASTRSGPALLLEAPVKPSQYCHDFGYRNIHPIMA